MCGILPPTRSQRTWCGNVEGERMGEGVPTPPLWSMALLWGPWGGYQPPPPMVNDFVMETMGGVPTPPPMLHGFEKSTEPVPRGVVFQSDVDITKSFGGGGWSEPDSA